jgi:transcription initiation factor TFIIIB Brf1 subunit/transcription initiation factor TFIIB
MSADHQYPPPSDEVFMGNVMAVRRRGADLVCAFCGCGMDESEFEDEVMHEWNCPSRRRDRRGRDPMQEMLDLLKERTG